MILTARRWSRFGNEVIKPESLELINFLKVLGKKEVTREVIEALAALHIVVEII